MIEIILILTNPLQFFTGLFLLDASEDMTGVMSGSIFHCLSPPSALQPIDHKLDIYLLGLRLNQSITNFTIFGQINNYTLELRNVFHHLSEN